MLTEEHHQGILWISKYKMTENVLICSQHLGLGRVFRENDFLIDPLSFIALGTV
jgi:hypothetical protein